MAELIINNSPINCSYLEFTTPNTDFIENIHSIIPLTPPICCHELEVGTNCCGLTTIPIPTYFPLQLQEIDTTTPDYNGTLYVRASYTLEGIDASCIKKIKFTKTVKTTYASNNTVEYNDVNLLTAVPSESLSQNVYDDPVLIVDFTNTNTSGTLVLDSYFLGTFVTANPTFTITVEITLCNDLVYKIEQPLTATIPNNLTGSNFTYDPPVVTYPEMPQGITLDSINNKLLLDPVVFGQDSNVLHSGIYYVALKQNGIADSDSIFVDCDVHCKVVDYISKNRDSNLFMMYEALKYADTCETLTYEQKCDIWRVLAKPLNYFIYDLCVDSPNDCGCN